MANALASKIIPKENVTNKENLLMKLVSTYAAPEPELLFQLDIDFLELEPFENVSA